MLQYYVVFGSLATALCFLAGCAIVFAGRRRGGKGAVCALLCFLVLGYAGYRIINLPPAGLLARVPAARHTFEMVQPQLELLRSGETGREQRAVWYHDPIPEDLPPQEQAALAFLFQDPALPLHAIAVIYGPGDSREYGHGTQGVLLLRDGAYSMGVYHVAAGTFPSRSAVWKQSLGDGYWILIYYAPPI